MQRLAVNIALREVMKITNSEISISDIRFRPFNSLRLSGIYAADLRGDTLLYIKDFSAGFSLWSLFSNSLQVSSADIDDFTIRLNADSIGGNLNVQFFIDAFSSGEAAPDTATSSTPFTVKLDNVLLTNGTVSYDILSAPKLSKGFDHNHIHIDSLRLATDFSFTSVEDFMVKLKHLSLNESSGFKLKELAGNVAWKNERIQLDDFVFRLTKSELLIDEAYVDYSTTTLDSLTTKATFSLPINKLVLHPSDVKMFYLPLEAMGDSLVAGLEVEGQLPAVNLESFYLIYGRTFSIDANASIESYVDWDSSPLELNIAQLLIDTRRLSRLVEQLASGGITGRIELPVNTGHVNLRTSLKGTLPDMQVDLNLLTTSGDMALRGRGGYTHSTGAAHIDAALTTAALNLGQLLANPLLGMASLRANVGGQINGSGSITATLNTNVSRFDFNGYRYRNIRAAAQYRNDNVRLTADIRDDNVPLRLKVEGESISTANARLLVDAEARHILFDSLNFIPQYTGADLYANIRAEVQNFDLDRMRAQVCIDSLRFKTNMGVFYQDSVRVKMENEENGFKAVSISAPIVEASAYGAFSFATLPVALSNSLSQYFNVFIPYRPVAAVSNDELNLYLLLRNTEFLSNTLSLPIVIPDSVMVSAYYNNQSNNVLLSAAVPSMKIRDMELLNTVVNVDNDTLAPKMGIFGRTRLYQGKQDTIRLAFEAKALGDSINLRAFAGDPSKLVELYALVDAAIHFKENKTGTMPLMDIGLNPGAIFVNRQRFNIKPSSIQIDDNRYTINRFELADTSGGHVRIDGVVSKSAQDTVRLQIEQLYLSSVMATLQSDINLKGVVNADIAATGVLSNPIVAARYFNVDSIVLNEKQIGNLEIASAWNSEQQAVMLDAELWQTNGVSSRVNGYIFPMHDKLSLNANVRGLELDWMEPMARDFLFGLSGDLGLQLSAEGKLSNPSLNGELLFNKASFGVKLTNVQYTIDDTVQITPDKLAFDQLGIADNEGNVATLSGSIGHRTFRNLDLDLNMRLRNFLLLNNPQQTDSMIYGRLGLNGNISISGTDRNILARAAVSNSGTGRVFFQLPESARTARRFTGITFINPRDTLANASDSLNRLFERVSSASAVFPLRLEMAFTLTPELTAGMVLSPATGDIASVSGNGNIQLLYDMVKDDISLLGDYTITRGNAAFSFQNILRKQFQIANGGRVTFRGDPMSTRFDVTAVYSLRADLATLDESFASDPYLSSSRVSVNCLIHVSGDINQVNISYDIQILNVDESIQRRVEGLLYNDDLKAKQIAFLLAFGRFNPPGGGISTGSSGTTWTTFLSSTLSTQLNNLLANVLDENWTVGTELRAGENGSNDIEANVMVSANLFNNRVTVTTNLGYRNTVTAPNDFTGDFIIEYKLTKAGDWIIRVFNVTNDQFFEQAPTTQGVGVVYKKEGKVFKELFKRRRRSYWRNREENAVEQRNGANGNAQQDSTAQQEQKSIEQ